MTTEEKRQAFERLRKLMKGMDLPPHRKSLDTLANIDWLRKNMGARNSSHKNYTAALEVCTELLAAG